MSDVIEFKRPPPRGPDEPRRSKFEDEWVLTWCGEWRAARAQQQKNWAEHNIATMWGTLPDADIKLDTNPLARMHELEGRLANMVPDTLQCAREMLGIAVTILAHAEEDPEATLAQGPVLYLVRNVVEALNELDGTMLLRYRKKKRSRKRDSDKK
jgi:hypothetical protein